MVLPSSLRSRPRCQAAAGPQGRPQQSGPQRVHSSTHRLQEEQDQGRRAAPQAPRQHRGHHRSTRGGMESREWGEVIVAIEDREW